MTFRVGAWGVAGIGLVLVASIGACSAAKNKGGLPGDDEVQSGGDDGESASSDDGGGGGSSGSSSGGAFSGSSSGSPGGVRLRPTRPAHPRASTASSRGSMPT